MCNSSTPEVEDELELTPEVEDELELDVEQEIEFGEGFRPGSGQVVEDIPADVPSIREYESRKDADLDRAMCRAIEAAEETGSDYLARVLALETADHFYENGR